MIHFWCDVRKTVRLLRGPHPLAPHPLTVEAARATILGFGASGECPANRRRARVVEGALSRDRDDQPQPLVREEDGELVEDVVGVQPAEQDLGAYFL